MISAISDAIPDIVEQYAQHWNLKDLGALLKTSKNVSAMVNNIRIMQIVLKNHEREEDPKNPQKIAALFFKSKYQVAIEQNDVNLARFIIDCNSEFVRFDTTPYVSEYFAHDADLILDFVWKRYIVNRDNFMVFLLSAAKYTVKPVLMLGSGVAYSKIPKCFEYILKQCSDYLNDLITCLWAGDEWLKERSQEWRFEKNIPSEELLELVKAVFFCRKKFPQYFSKTFNINEPIGYFNFRYTYSELIPEYTPLQIAAKLQNSELLELFLEHGASIDDNGGIYIKMAYENYCQGTGRFVQILMEKIALHGECNLRFLLHSENPYTRFMIEDLLNKGATLSQNNNDMECNANTKTFYLLWTASKYRYTREDRIITNSDEIRQFLEKHSKNHPLVVFKLIRPNAARIASITLYLTGELTIRNKITVTEAFSKRKCRPEVEHGSWTLDSNGALTVKISQKQTKYLFVRLFNNDLALLPESSLDGNSFEASDLCLPDISDEDEDFLMTE